ncbi:MAG: helix-hairpin-helix domain-containing protein [Acidilobaceae archaeon]|nr:helix-hairpin-helix domain-containing protein [Acidilobaceae archaeon]MCX8165595.1 helix-hairpin-helix domain-containing protein [Acidilobaceae archaeon]MDW7974022.1 ERCC4 domain-containing protein [Sulfolobales archaeon]
MQRALRIYADYREEQSGIPALLEKMGVIVIRENLSVGDYLLPGDVVVERKTAEDYINSLHDGRLFDQVRRVLEVYDNLLLIVEGDLEREARLRGREKHVTSSIASLLLESVKVVSSSGPRYTAHLLEALAKKSSETRGKRVVIHRKPKLESTREWQIYVISSFPGVGEKMAEKILEHYKTVEAFCLSSISELQRVVGEKRAERIKTILKARYGEEEKRGRSLDDYS